LNKLDMKAKASDVAPLVSRIGTDILAGLAPEVQGAVLADLTALYFAGHHPSVREQVLAMHFEAIRSLIDVNIKIAIREGKLPPEWVGATRQ
jgi:hypothetical protein